MNSTKCNFLLPAVFKSTATYNKAVVVWLQVSTTSTFTTNKHRSMLKLDGI